jgi:protein-tyrosine phosphatase
MAEFIFKDMINKANYTHQFYIASVATSTEEIWNGIGNPVYPPAKQELVKHGISCDGKRAVQLQRDDYDKYDYLIGMDSANIRNMIRILGGDPEGKVHLLLEYAGLDRDIADPWYTGKFDKTYNDIVTGCEALLNHILEVGDITCT